MTEMLEVDSLGFLSVEGLYWAMGEEYRSEDCPQYTDHCFTGDYPTPLIDRDRRRMHACSPRFKEQRCDRSTWRDY